MKIKVAAMQRICLALSLLLFTVHTSRSNDIFGDGFARNDLSSYLEKVAPQNMRFEVSAAGDKRLETTASIQFKSVPVTQRTKYHVRFTAGKSGGLDFASELMHTATLFYARCYPTAQVAFFDTDGKERRQGKFVPLSIYSDVMKTYDLVFYAPDNAAWMKLVFNVPKDYTLSLAGFEMRESRDEDINVNGDFSLGEYNYCGIQSANDACLRIVRGSDGQNGLFTGFYAHTTAFPLEPGAKYSLTMAGQGYYKNRVDSFLMLLDPRPDANGKARPVQKVSLPRIERSKKEEIVYDFIAPENVTWARLWIYKATITRISVRKL